MPWAHSSWSPSLRPEGNLVPCGTGKLCPPSPLTWGRCDPVPKDFPAASSPEALRAGGGDPANPYLSVSPVSRSWGPCDWSAFSPGRSAAWSPPESRQGLEPAAGHTDCSFWRRLRAARPAGARRVRLISIAHHLGQPAPSTAGRGREATPRTGARAGGTRRVVGGVCPTGLGWPASWSRTDPAGDWPSTCPG